jgi:hypothetical protein
MGRDKKSRVSTNGPFREWSIGNADGDLFHSEKTAVRNSVVEASEKQSARMRGHLAGSVRNDGNGYVRAIAFACEWIECTRSVGFGSFA